MGRHGRIGRWLLWNVYVPVGCRKKVEDGTGG